MDKQFPKTLIVSRGVWDDHQGTSSTLTNFFEDYDPSKLAQIYIETKQPNTSCCYRFFQISEFSLVHKFWKWKLKTGHAFDTRDNDQMPIPDVIARQEAGAMGYVRGHRSLAFSFLREILWSFNGWKSKELLSFILDFNPDVIWLDGSPLPLMNRLYDYVLKIARKPASIFMQDDVFSYNSCGKNIFKILRRHHLRRTVRRVVGQCSNMFVASPKMKQEYDGIFNVDSVFIAKSFNLRVADAVSIAPHRPLRMVYLGQVIYGRIKTLIAISEALASINKNGTKIQLFVYTNNQIEEIDKQLLLKGGNTFINDPVPYDEVPSVINNNDVVVFVETFDSQLNKIARLSFSTKISDYLRSRKCIIAIGPSDVAPIQYFLEEDAAIVATDSNEILLALNRLTDSEIVRDYAIKAYACALKNHERKKMNATIYGKLIEISQGMS